MHQFSSGYHDQRLEDNKSQQLAPAISVSRYRTSLSNKFNRYMSFSDFLSFSLSIVLYISTSPSLPFYHSLFLSFHRSLYLYVPLSPFLPFSLSIFPSFSISLRPPLSLSTILSFYLSIVLYISTPPLSLSTILSFYLSIFPSFSISLYLYVPLSSFLPFSLSLSPSHFLYLSLADRVAIGHQRIWNIFAARFSHHLSSGEG